MLLELEALHRSPIGRGQCSWLANLSKGIGTSDISDIACHVAIGSALSAAQTPWWAPSRDAPAHTWSMLSSGQQWLRFDHAQLFAAGDTYPDPCCSLEPPQWPIKWTLEFSRWPTPIGSSCLHRKQYFSLEHPKWPMKVDTGALTVVNTDWLKVALIGGNV